MRPADAGPTRRALLVGAAGALAAPRLARAQTASSTNWPAQPVRIIVTQAAGGAPDILCRMAADRLSRAFGQPFIVENRPGSGNIVGMVGALHAPADGNTLVWATAAALTTNLFTVKALPYDPARDFVTVARVAKGPFLVVANPSLPANTLPELIALAREKPGALNFATDGPRNFSGLVAGWLDRTAGVDIPQVPYAAMPQGVQDVVSGRVQLAVLAVPAAAPMLKGGLLKALATTTASRTPGYEQVAPVAETLPGFDFFGWMAVAARTGTPRPILEKLNAALSVILEDREFADAMAKVGFYSFGAQTLAEADAAVHDELALWRKLVAEIGVEPE